MDQNKIDWNEVKYAHELSIIKYKFIIKYKWLAVCNDYYFWMNLNI